MTIPSRKPVWLGGFDYSTPGCNFVTINARTREPWFGDVADGMMIFNAAGDMVLRTWRRLADQFPGVVPDVAVAMPDHFHGIIMLGTDPAVTTRPSSSAVVGAFKSMTTVEYGRGVRSEGWRPFVGQLWYRSFRDTIIRTDHSLDNFRDYIDGNPGRWSEKRGE